MGRGIADYEYAVLVSIPLFDDAGQECDDYEDWAVGLCCTTENALKKAEHVGEWEDDLYILAQTDKVRVALIYEDTYVQVVCLPRCYRRWIAEDSPTCEGYDHTGSNYQNAKGEWIIECEIPYNIHRQAKKFFHRLCKAVGVVDSANATYKNVGARTSAWTSGRIRINEETPPRAWGRRPLSELNK